MLVRGGAGNVAESFTLSVTPAAYALGSASPVIAGAGCVNASATEVSCPKPAAPLGYATLYGAVATTSSASARASRIPA